MSKIINTIDGKKIRRVSRWIRIRSEYNITPRHSLYDYCDTYSDNSIDYFMFKGKKYALGQFVKFGGCCITPYIQWYESDKLFFLSGYDCTNYYNPLLIEIDECGEAVRLYEEVRD
jgi:hypothetical protein